MYCVTGLNSKHHEARLQFCKVHMADNFQHTWFSDEKKFCLSGPDGWGYYWHDLRREPQYFETSGSRKSVMVWGAISWNAKTSLAFIDTTMDALKYQTLLQDHLLPHLQQDDVFQQDNASCHTARSTKEWLCLRLVPFLVWPSKSPDLNPIENIWGQLVRKVYSNGRHYNSTAVLKRAIQAAWDQMPQADIQAVVASMPSRIFQCIANKGGNTNY